MQISRSEVTTNKKQETRVFSKITELPVLMAGMPAYQQKAASRFITIMRR